MLAPYYEGDAVPVSFYVREGFKPRIPQSAIVTIYRGKRIVLPNVQAEVSGNLVSYTVSGDYTRQRGDYMAEFTVYLPIPRTHKMWFRILPKGAVISKSKDAEFTRDITKDSSNDRVDVALGLALRSLRKSGEVLLKASKDAGDILSKKTKKKLPIDQYSEEGY